MANFAFSPLGSLIVSVADARPPLDDEWSAFLSLSEAHARACAPEEARTVFFTDGGSPTASQRRATSQLRRRQRIDTALVTDSPVLHSMATMLGFVNPGLRLFGSAGWPEAAAFVRIAPGARPEVLALAAALARDIGEVKVLRALGL